MTDEELSRELNKLSCALEFWDGFGVDMTFNERKFRLAVFKAGKAAEREEIAQMFDAEHEKRKHLDNHALCAAVAIRARK